jgi:hypothetical protein
MSIELQLIVNTAVLIFFLYSSPKRPQRGYHVYEHRFQLIEIREVWTLRGTE